MPEGNLHLGRFVPFAPEVDSDQSEDVFQGPLNIAKLRHHHPYKRRVQTLTLCVCGEPQEISIRETTKQTGRGKLQDLIERRPRVRSQKAWNRGIHADSPS